MSSAQTRIKLAGFYIIQEILSIERYKRAYNYLVPFSVGLSLNLIEYGQAFHSLAPYLVPLFVQSLTRGISAYTNRYHLKPADLPRLQDDPFFLINKTGRIICTEAAENGLLNELSIDHIDGLETKDPLFLDKVKRNDGHSFEVYVQKSKRWFEVFTMRKTPENYCVWLHDISKLKRKDESLRRVLKFNSAVTNNNIAHNDVSSILSSLAKEIIAQGYQGAFILRDCGNGQYQGHCYKQDHQGNLLTSNEFSLHHDEHLPVFASRKNNGFVRANINDFKDQQEFYQRYNFHPDIKAFLENPIVNLIDFHSEKVSIIAFNKDDDVSLDDELLLEPLVSSAQSLINMADKNLENESLFYAAITGLCAAAEYSDDITGQHVWRVNKYAELLATKMELSVEKISAISKVAALHDIGKVAIPELIKFSGKYTDEQRNQMQNHAIIGADIIDKMQEKLSYTNTALQMAKEIALNHHQYWDGTGYPGLKKANGEIIQKDYCIACHDYQNLTPLKGDEIPVHALIVSLADTYDALRNERQYKPAFSHEKTVQIMTNDDRSGKSGLNRWGPIIWPLFIKYQDLFDDIYQKMSS